MPRTYYLVIAEDDAPLVVPDVTPGGSARTIPSPDPYPLLERIAEECSAADLEHFKLFALCRIQRQVAGVAPQPTPMSAVGRAVAS
jgi:hypothetical protein